MSAPGCEDEGCDKTATMLHYIHAGTTPDGPLITSWRYCDEHAAANRSSPRFRSEEPWTHAGDPIFSQFEEEIVPDSHASSQPNAPSTAMEPRMDMPRGNLFRPECDEPGCGLPVTMMHTIHAKSADGKHVRWYFRYCADHSAHYLFRHPDSRSAGPWEAGEDPIRTGMETETDPEIDDPDYA
jgi:hypothetical protein